MATQLTESGSNNKIRIALVQPFGFDIKCVVPLSLAYLKANLDEELCDVRIIDCALRGIKSNSQELKRLLLSFDPHIVAVSTWSRMFHEALDILRTSKTILRDVTTVIGGSHASTYYEEVMKNNEIDFLFRGEAEITFASFIEKMRNKTDFTNISGLVWRDTNRSLVTNEPLMSKDLDKIKLPDYDSINFDEYIELGYSFFTRKKRNAPILLTRGCPYSCQYCAAPLLNGNPVRKHSPEYAILWIKHLYYEKDIRHINIIDDNFTFDVAYAKNICRQIVQLDLHDLTFGTPNGIRMQRGDSELWNLMKSSGWRDIVVAPESGSKRTLERMRKNLNPDIIPGIVDSIKKAGLNVAGFFMIGYPDETKEDLIETHQLVMKTNFDYVSLFFFQPLPGTPIFNSLVKKGEISSDFLPNDYFTFKPNYRTNTLGNMNLLKFLFLTYLFFYLKRPTRILFLLTKYNAFRILKRFLGCWHGSKTAVFG